MGSCGLDYLAQVAAFPQPDDKLRTERLEVHCLYPKPSSLSCPKTNWSAFQVRLPRTCVQGGSAWTLRYQEFCKIKQNSPCLATTEAYVCVWT